MLKTKIWIIFIALAFASGCAAWRVKPVKPIGSEVFYAAVECRF